MTIDAPALLANGSALVTWPRPGDVAASELREALRRGGRVVVLADAAAVPAVAHLLAAAGFLDLPGELPVPELVGRPDDADPLVLDTHLRAVAADGSVLAADGWADLGALHEAWQGAEVPARIGDRPVVVEGPAGPDGARLVVVGSATLAGSRWLPVADNAVFLSWALSGERGTSHALQNRRAVAGRVKDAPAGDPRLPHPEVPVVVADAAPQLVAAARRAAHTPSSGADAGTDPGISTGSQPALDDEDFLAAVRHAARLLPPAVHDALVDFADHAPPAGALLVRGLPVGAVPPTPLVPGAVEKDRVSEFVLLTVARRLGHPIGYLPEHGGRIVQDLSPTPDAVTRQTSTSSGVELAFHTETAFHPHRPRYLLLLCLRGDPAAFTTLCSVHAAVQHLTLGQVAVLREARFRTGIDESFTGGRSSALGRLVPVISGTDDAPSLTFDADLMVGDDPEAQAALDTFAAAVAAAKIGVSLRTGDLIVVDNQVAVHGRSPFDARFDGTDRWLQRTFVVPDLALSAADRTGRIITTRFVR